MRIKVTSTEEYIFDYSDNLDQIKETFANPNMSHASRDASKIGGSKKIISIEEYDPPYDELINRMVHYIDEHLQKVQYWRDKLIETVLERNKENEDNRSIK